MMRLCSAAPFPNDGWMDRADDLGPWSPSEWEEIQNKMRALYIRLQIEAQGTIPSVDAKPIFVEDTHECPICCRTPIGARDYGEGTFSHIALTPCGHWICTHCLPKVMEDHGARCCQCRRDLTDGKIRICPIADRTALRGAHEEFANKAKQWVKAVSGQCTLDLNESRVKPDQDESTTLSGVTLRLLDGSLTHASTVSVYKMTSIPQPIQHEIVLFDTSYSMRDVIHRIKSEGQLERFVESRKGSVLAVCKFDSNAQVIMAPVEITESNAQEVTSLLYKEVVENGSTRLDLGLALVRDQVVPAFGEYLSRLGIEHTTVKLSIITDGATQGLEQAKCFLSQIQSESPCSGVTIAPKVEGVGEEYDYNNCMAIVQNNTSWYTHHDDESVLDKMAQSIPSTIIEMQAKGPESRLFYGGCIHAPHKTGTGWGHRLVTHDASAIFCITDADPEIRINGNHIAVQASSELAFEAPQHILVNLILDHVKGLTLGVEHKNVQGNVHQLGLLKSFLKEMKHVLCNQYDTMHQLVCEQMEALVSTSQNESAYEMMGRLSSNTQATCVNHSVRRACTVPT